MKRRESFCSSLAVPVMALIVLSGGFLTELVAYPPGVGILGPSKNCLACHSDNGPWREDGRTIIDIVDAATKKSLKAPDGSFLIEARRGEVTTVLTVAGRLKESGQDLPYRHAWLYLDPQTIGTASLSKFAPGWDCNLPMACRISGDKLDSYPEAGLTVLPMSVRPSDSARDAVLQLQLMLTKGESVKGKAKEGMIGNYYVRTVRLRVLERPN